MKNIIRENIENLVKRASRNSMNFQTFTEHLLDSRNGTFVLITFVPAGIGTYKAYYRNAIQDWLEVKFYERESGELILWSVEIHDCEEKNLTGL